MCVTVFDKLIIMGKDWVPIAIKVATIISSFVLLASSSSSRLKL